MLFCIGAIENSTNMLYQDFLDICYSCTSYCESKINRSFPYNEYVLDNNQPWMKQQQFELVYAKKDYRKVDLSNNQQSLTIERHVSFPDKVNRSDYRLIGESLIDQ